MKITTVTPRPTPPDVEIILTSDEIKEIFNAYGHTGSSISNTASGTFTKILNELRRLYPAM